MVRYVFSLLTFNKNLKLVYLLNFETLNKLKKINLKD